MMDKQAALKLLSSQPLGRHVGKGLMTEHHVHTIWSWHWQHLIADLGTR